MYHVYLVFRVVSWYTRGATPLPQADKKGPASLTVKTLYPNIGPVVGIKLYRQDTVVVRDGTAPPPHIPERGEIMQFSKKSRQRLAFVATNTDVTFRTMITLTYPKDYPSDGKAVKAHLNAFLTWLRRESIDRSYLWFLEWQQRGAPHFHILWASAMPTRMEDRKALRFRVAATWYRLVDSGDEKHLAAGTRAARIRKERGARNYCVKYAFKMKQKTVPEGYRNVGRMWGASRDVQPVCRTEVKCTEDDVRSILEGWDYEPDEERTLYTVLYETAPLFTEHLLTEKLST